MVLTTMTSSLSAPVPGSLTVVLTTMTSSLSAPVPGAGGRQQTRLVHGAFDPVAFDGDHHRRTHRPSVERIGRKSPKTKLASC